MSFKPMLATDHDPKALRFPYLASPKLDGIRCICIDGVAMTRSLKPVPNEEIQQFFRANARILNNLDGELVCGAPYGDNVMQRTSSGVMSRAGTPDWSYWVFDMTPNEAIPAHAPFSGRLLSAAGRVAELGHIRIRYLTHTMITTEETLGNYEKACLSDGFEGVMLRDPRGHYKLGRATVRENSLLKVKRFADGEGEIIDFKERMHNANEATVDNLGHTKRSTHQENKVPLGVMGALTVKVLNGPYAGSTCDVSGFTATQQQQLWDARQDLVGKVITFKYFPTGSVERPRFPVFKGFRDRSDMS